MKKFLRVLPVAGLAAAGISTLSVTTAAAENRTVIDLPAQPLGAALKQLAEKTGVQIFFADESVRGRSAPASKGNLTVREALDGMLAGSGLVYSFTAGNAVSVRPADKGADGGPMALPALNVTAENAHDTGYTMRSTVTATKTDTPVLDTPISVQTVTREVLDDQQITTLKGAMKNVSGVQSSPNEFYDRFLIRGFDTSAATYRDGLQFDNTIGATEMAFADRVDVVKGPSSMLYGRVEPGGFVNIVTKQPLPVAAYSLQQQFGSFGEYRTVADATGPATADGSLLYRAIGVYDRGDSWIDFQQHDKKDLATYFTWKPTERFTANFGFEVYNNEFTGPSEGNFIPVIGGQIVKLPRHFTVGDPVLNELPTGGLRTVLAFDWSYAFDASWKISQRFHWSNSDETQNLISSFFPPPAGGTVQNRSIWLIPDWNRESYATNLNLEGKFRTAGIDHTLLVGADWYKYTDIESGRETNNGIVPPIDIFNPVYGNISAAALRALPKDIFFQTYRDDYGLYIQDQLSLDDRWYLLLGGRYDWGKWAFSDGDDAAPVKPVVGPSDAAFSPHFGVLYKVLPEVSVYGSYAESFGQGNLGRMASGSSFEPQSAQQWEAGIKASLLGDRLMASATFFDLTKQNLPTPDPNNPLFNILTGEARSRGVEFDVVGQVIDNLRLIANYAFDDAVVTRDNTTGIFATQGHRLQNMPRHASRLWGVWDTAPGRTEGWEFGGGIRYVGDRAGNNFYANSNAARLYNFIVPAYTIVDAMISYRFEAFGKPIKAQFNVENLFDIDYYDRSYFNRDVAYGAPRTFLGSLKVAF